MITQDELKEVMLYSPETGLFFWKIDRIRVKGGDRAGFKSALGYRMIQINGRPYMEHRLAFVYMTGLCPKRVDHKNEDRLDNRWSNLRKASASENGCNRGAPSNNTSGTKGVYWSGKKQKWKTKVKLNGKSYYFGVYDCIKDAARAVKAGRRRCTVIFAIMVKWFRVMGEMV